jgi:hypothetical protein
MTDPHLPPPWERYPEWPGYSLMWRMGPGEEYWLEWWIWYNRLDGDAKRAFRQRHPAPPEWPGFYDDAP